MNNLKPRLSERVMAIVLSILMVVGLFPVTAFAEDKSVLTTDIGEKKFIVGETTEFSFTTVANDDVGKYVIGSSNFSDPDAIEKLEYYEVKDGNWYEFDGDFGPSTGFPMSDATSKFRVTFKTAGEYTFTAYVKAVDGGDVLCEVEKSINVSEPERNSSTLTTDIGAADKVFVVGEPTEFTFTTTANDDKDIAVIGTSDFSDPDAIEKLEYYEINNDTWYELNGDFGSSAGFPMSDATSKFRVTFKKGGDYTFTASMKNAETGDVLCSSGEIDFHVKSKYTVNVNQTGEGSILLNGAAAPAEGLTVTESETVALSVVPTAGWEIASVCVGSVNQTISNTQSFEANVEVNVNIDINVTFVKVYTVTVSYESAHGSVVTDPENIGGSVTVQTGTDVTVTATPNATYRVSKVEITDITVSEFSDNTYNATTPYKKTLTADKDYTVTITFAPLVYNVDVTATVNGTVNVDKTSVEYDNSVNVTVKPESGYTVDVAKVNGSSVYNSISETEDDGVFVFTIENIQEDKNIEITFKECESASMSDVSWNSSAALRSDGSLYVFAKGNEIVFNTEKQGIRITTQDTKVYGDKTTQSITLTESTKIIKIELRYDFGWHEVLVDGKSVELNLSIDEGKPSVDVKANKAANANGYYNSDVTLTVCAKDSGEWSGIAYIEYWIECDSKKSEPQKIYTHEDGNTKNDVKIDDVKIIAADNDSDKVKVYVKAVDRAGNVSDEATLGIKFCTTLPGVTVNFDDKQSQEADESQNWYNKSRTATITIVDRADVFDETAATNGISFGQDSVEEFVISEWSSNGNTHTATVTFENEGRYSWDYSYTNKAGLEAQVAKSGDNTDSFGIDKTAPGGTLKSQSASWDGRGYDWKELLEKLTFGLYSNEEVTVVLTENSDNLSGYQSVSYYVSNSDEILSESELDSLYNDGKFTSDSISINRDEQFAVYARIVDNAGNYAYIGTNGIIYDKTAGEIEIQMADKPNENQMYGAQNVKEYDVNGQKIFGIRADINVSDLKEGTYYSGIKKIEYTVSCGSRQTQSGTLFEFTNTQPTKDELCKDWNGSVIIDANENNGKNVTLTVTVTDNAGNKSDNSITLKEINLDDITATVTITGSAVKLDENGYGWYNAGRTATVMIQDRASAFDEDAATKAIKWTITDKDGNVIDATDCVSIGEWANNENTHMVSVEFCKDGKYSWYLDYENKAGNKLSENKIYYGNAQSPKAFTIDKTQPTGSITIGKYSWIDKILSVLTFGLYSNAGFEVSVAAGDTDNISPVTTEYYVYEGTAALSEGNLDALYNSGAFSADKPVLNTTRQFTVYVRITDYANNRIYISSDGHVIDKTGTELDMTVNDNPNENGIYGKDNVKEYGDVDSAIGVLVSVKEAESVDDVYSGIKEITYEVKSRNSDNEEYVVTQTGTLYSFKYERDPSDNSNGGKLTITDVNNSTAQIYSEFQQIPTKDMLCREWHGVVVVDAAKNNKCDVVVTVKVTDNAGNETTKTINGIDIDISSPTIEVSFDNNNVKNDKYFDKARTATVVFKEREHHFDAAAAEKIITDSITSTELNGTQVEDAYSIKWLSNDANDTFIAEVYFEKSANYTFDVSYTDEAGNANEKVVYSANTKAPNAFVVDKTSPTGTVTVNGKTWTKFLETITFGMYSATSVNISATGSDDISSVTVEYYKSNADVGLSKVELASLEFLSYDEAIEVKPNEQFNIYVKLMDKAGNITLLNSDGFIVDAVESAISVKAEDTANENGIYGLENVKDYSEEAGIDKGIKVHVEVNETDENANSGIANIKYEVVAKLQEQYKTTQSGTLYDFAYTRDEGENSNGGKLTVTDVNADKIEKDGQVPVKTDLCTSWSGNIIVDATKNNSSEVYVRVTVTDNAGNKTDYTVDAKAQLSLDIDLTSPTIEVEFDNNSALNEKYFDAVRTATVTITERANHFNGEKATGGIEITAVNADGTTVNNAYVINGWTPSVNEMNPDSSTYTATVEFKEDANYTFAISYTDEAGNANTVVNFGTSVAPQDFVVDKNNPTGSVTVNGSKWTRFLETITFGLYSNYPVKVSATGSDKTSPVKVEYYKSNADTGLLDNDLSSLTFVSYEPFEVSSDEQFNVYVKVTDYAGNSTILNSDGFIVDTLKSAVIITAEDSSNANGIYGLANIKDYSDIGEAKQGIKVHIKVNETDETVNSGIANIKYKVVAKLQGQYKTTQSGTLYDFSYTRDEGEDSNGGKLTVTDVNADKIEKDGQVPLKTDLCTSWSGDIIVDAEKNNSSEVYVRVTVTDNAGNKTDYTVDEKAQLSLDIDLTPSTIEVKFDKNGALNEKYFNATRTATVTITERSNHFNSENASKGITITAANADGTIVNNAYVINGWVPSVNETNPDASTYTATVEFKEDANYTFAISYTDEAGNANTAVDFGTSVAPQDFVVDTNEPNGSVTVNGSKWTRFLETITFGLFSKNSATVSATATDKTSPVKIEYFKSNGDLGENKANLSSLELISAGDYAVGKNETLFKLSTTEQFTVYVKITDKAGHVVWINSDGYVVDKDLSPISVSAVTKANENNIYGLAEVKELGGVKLHIEANDTKDGSETYYSGIKSISYTVNAKLNGKTMTETKSETLYDFNYTRDGGDDSNGGTLVITDANADNIEKSGQVPVKTDLCTSWSGDIVIDAAANNCSEVVVTVTVVDNAGNVNKDSITLDIDVTCPTIDVQYDNNIALNEKYFDAVRTATIQITERDDHFSKTAATQGISITAVDANGKEVKDAYKVSVWTPKEIDGKPNETVHTATVEFKKDANYTFDISYTDKAGNSNDGKVDYSKNSIATNEFTVDTVAPEEAKISINEYSWSKLLKVLTFGLFTNGKADVKIEASDTISPYIVEYYKTNDPVAKDSGELDKLYADGKFKAYSEYTVNPNEQFVVYAKITDFAGNYTYIGSDGFIVDNVGPEIVLSPDQPNENNIYNSDVNVKISTTDSEPYSGIAKVEYWVVTDGKETQRQTLFSFDYTRETGENTNNGSLVITDWADGTEKISTLQGNVPTQAQLYASWNGSFTVNGAINDSSNVKVYVGVTDNAGNYSQKELKFDIDVTDPVIKVSYADKANENAKSGYYTERSATISITERTNHFDAAAATKGIVITAEDVKGTKIDNAYTISSWTTVEGATPDDAVHTATIKYLADANYTFAVSYSDKARNENVSVDVSGQQTPYKFTVDKTSPVGTVTAKSAEGRSETWSSIVDSLTFGFWSNTKISVTTTSDDVTSPIQSVEYYMSIAQSASDNTNVLKKAELDEITEWKNFADFDVTDNMQFTVYVKITDNAGNYTYISTNGLIVDEEHPVEESVAPEISVSPVKPVNGIYSDDVKVSIEVTDPMVGGTYSGIKEVSYAVFDRDSTSPDVPTQKGTLYTFNVANPKQSDLEQTWTGEITVSAAKNNSNNIQIVVYAKDNSLNAVDNSQKEAKSYTVIKIDTTAPTIDVSYDNNSADSATYFKSDRTATVTVTERNFNADDVKITVTNTDGVIPAVVGWTHTEGTNNRDDATHTATITYAADGDYTFDISYTDEAGNECSSVKYAQGTVAATQFTIDKTVPTVSVSYDNNTCLNSNYYDSRRTAAIVINEHNFSTDRVNISMTAQDNGRSAAVPAINGWTTNGDTHTATVLFVNDAFYTFDIEYADLAGNSAAEYTQDSFYIDNTDPVLDITPEELNGSANNGEVRPVITASDTNFDENQVNITLVGANNGEITKLNGSYSSIDNGRVFTFEDFEQTKETDDIYTLHASVTDKAGRSTSDEVTFSVNRFGSVYVLDDATSELNNTYVKESGDIVITEINTDKLTNIKLTLFKNDETVILKEGTDYKVTQSGGGNQWYKYVYTVFASNFTDDGVYRLSIHSEDTAGNVAENTLDTKDMEIKFGVDSTAPIINVNNLESGETYALEKMTVQMTISDNLNLKEVIVYLDSQEYQSWSEDSLNEAVVDGGNFSFDISGDSKSAHNLKIVVVDAAGNEHVEEVKDFFVTTDMWVRYYNDKVMFYGSIFGVVILIALLILIPVIRKKRKT